MSLANQGKVFRNNFQGDPHATFFNGSDHFDFFDFDAEDDLFNPFRRFPFSHVGGFPAQDGGNLPRGQRRLQGKEVVHELLVTLDEVMQGCTKHVKITRSRLNPDSRSLRTEEKVLNVVVKKGWRAGTKITFPREGDETPNSTPADITFILRDKEHNQYKRDGSNILYTAQITLKEVSLDPPVRKKTVLELVSAQTVNYETHEWPLSTHHMHLPTAYTYTGSGVKSIHRVFAACVTRQAPPESQGTKGSRAFKTEPIVLVAIL